MLEQGLVQGSNDTKMFVAVAGNIGCGKTTLTNKLSERLGWKPAFESVKDNPYLDDFYKDMKKYSFPLQVYFLNHRFAAHKAIVESSGSAIQDRTIYEDFHIFARNLYEIGQMSKRDYNNYCSLYNSIIQYLEPPTLMIFLRRSVPKLMERIKLRDRECERDISSEYIAKLNSYYEEWYSAYDRGKYLVVDTDDLDFLENENHFEALVRHIYNSIEQQNLFFKFH